MSASTKQLGLFTLIALVVGNMIGSGVFLLPAALAPYGAASLLGWALTLGGALLLALVYAWLAQSVRNHGGGYGYARRAFGDGTGFVSAWSYWVSIWTAIAAIAVAFAGSIGAVWPALTATPWRGAACALAALWFCTAVNLAGVREAGYMQVILTVLKLVPLLLFGVIGLFWIEPGVYQPFNPSGQPLFQATTAVAALALWAMLGLESATVPTGVVRDPERTVPRATVIGMLIAGVTTMLACTVVIGLLPVEVLRHSAAPMAEAASRLWGPAAGIGVGVAASIACFGALNGWVLLQGQAPLAAAQDRVFPAPFARMDGRGTPRFSLLLGGVLASILIAANYSRSLVGLFTFSILLSTAACLLPYVISVLAWWRIDPHTGRLRKWVAAGALLYSLWALVGTGVESLLWAGALVLAGLPVFLWQRRIARPRPPAAA